MTSHVRYAELLVDGIECVDKEPTTYRERVDRLTGLVSDMTVEDAARTLLALRRGLDRPLRVRSAELATPGGEGFAFSKLLAAYARSLQAGDENLAADHSTDVSARWLAARQADAADSAHANIMTVDLRSRMDAPRTNSLARSEEASSAQGDEAAAQFEGDRGNPTGEQRRAVEVMRALEAFSESAGAEERAWMELRSILALPEEQAALDQVVAEYTTAPLPDAVTVSPAGGLAVCRDVDKLVCGLTIRFPSLRTAFAAFPEILARKHDKHCFTSRERADHLQSSLDEVPDDLIIRLKLVEALCTIERGMDATDHVRYVLEHPESLGRHFDEIEPVVRFVSAVACCDDVELHLGKSFSDLCWVEAIPWPADNYRCWKKIQKGWLQCLHRIGHKSETVLTRVRDLLFPGTLEQPAWHCVPFDLAIAYYAAQLVDWQRSGPGVLFDHIRDFLNEYERELSKQPWTYRILLKDACARDGLDLLGGGAVSRDVQQRLSELYEGLVPVRQADRLATFAAALLEAGKDVLHPEARLVLMSLRSRALRECGPATTALLPAVHASDALRHIHELPSRRQQAGLELTHAIEIALHGIVVHVLRQRFGESWWTQGVPRSIRKEAAQLHEDEDEEIPKDACLYLIHRKEIIDKQWAVFAPYFEGSPSMGKAKSLEWVQTLNALRNRLAHPLKSRHKPLQKEEIDFLDERLPYLQRVAREVGIPPERWVPAGGAPVRPSRN